MMIKREWSEYYPNQYVTNDIDVVPDKNPFNLVGNAHHYVHDVSFIEFTKRPLFYENRESDNTLLLVERVLFQNNVHDGNVVNLWFTSKGQCIQNKCCCVNCTSIFGIGGTHSEVYVSKSSTYNNFIHQTSITETRGGRCQGIFRQSNGLMQVHNVNITKCNDDAKSICLFTDSNNDLKITQSNFQNNTARSYQGLTSTSTYHLTINQCNIITQCTSSGIVEVYGNARIDSCVIKDNFATDNLIFSFRSTARIINSYINNPRAQSISGTIPVTERPVFNSDELGLDLFITALCKGGRPQQMRVLRYIDYTQFAADFCETFNNRNNQGQSTPSILNSYFILMAS